jgi:nitrate reductase gamma subunit
MSGPAWLFWIVLPYVALTTFVVGHAWRWRRDQFGWTSRSSQLMESRLLRWGGPLFHYGAFAAIAGHVLGILVPASWTAALGISEPTYHLLSAGAGTAAGMAVVAGFLILLYRRLSVPRVAVSTTRIDLAVYLLLTTTIGLGILETVGVNLLGGGYDYRATVAVWFRGLFLLDPHPELMVGAPTVYQLHVISAWLLFALWPFSRLVHAWSYPILYLGRPWILYRGYRRRAPVPASSLGARQ